ncbi:hypothetical protein FAI40_02995 [Acetobacteraceae bacterium]|nr:hypothetical protein FAI40_02995 [Acetobacteraceae bacterium]
MCVFRNTLIRSGAYRFYLHATCSVFDPVFLEEIPTLKFIILFQQYGLALEKILNREGVLLDPSQRSKILSQNKSDIEQAFDFLLRKYASLLHRRVPLAKRSVHEAKGLHVAEQYRPAYAEIKRRSESGESLVPFQSKLVKKENYQDDMLNDFGVLHFHLGNIQGKTVFPLEGETYCMLLFLQTIPIV